ncbi:ATP-dependent Clp protease adapter ClpS [Candidatus Nitrosoglobus terrae]|nr:ATP-dependent Clp protease adapter ClpS [Candidatus Nitrosoglobus terrae]
MGKLYPDEGNKDIFAIGVAKPKIKPPSMYKVVMLNDDYTPMEFVVKILQTFFAMNLEQATRIMWQVHIEGQGICGVFTYEIAETKMAQVNEYSVNNQHPLKCILEKA